MKVNVLLIILISVGIFFHFEYVVKFVDNCASLEYTGCIMQSLLLIGVIQFKIEH